MPLLQAGQNIMLTNVDDRIRIDCVIPEGPQGEQGIGIADLSIQSTSTINDIITYEMTSTLTNGNVIKVGEFNVQQGSIGPAGKDGLDGKPGTPGLDALTCSAVLQLTEEPIASQVINVTISKDDFNEIPIIKDIFLIGGVFNSVNYLLNAKVVNTPSLENNNLIFDIEIKYALQIGIIPARFVKLDNGSTPVATNGTLTEEQLNILTSSEDSYILLSNEKYYLSDKEHVAGYLTYSHVGYENSMFILKSITITINTKGWVLTSLRLPQNLESTLANITTYIENHS